MESGSHFKCGRWLHPVRYGDLKNDFSPWGEEDFRRMSPQQGISIQELSLSDSEILHFLHSDGMSSTFSTASTQSGSRARKFAVMHNRFF